MPPIHLLRPARGTPPPRADGQGIAAYGRGSKRLALQIAADPEQSSAAEDELRGRIFAKTSTAPLAMKLETWKDIAIAAGIADPFALDEDILYKVSAILWKSNYRSIDGYLSAVKQELTLLHGSLPQAFWYSSQTNPKSSSARQGPRQAVVITSYGAPCRTGRSRRTVFGAWPRFPP